MEERENVSVECPICETEFITSTDAKKTQCPVCEFVFELED